MQTQRTYPRIRTALFSADGGLTQKKQFVRMGVMLPTPQIREPKIYMNSVMRDEDDPQEPDESLSIRLGDAFSIKTGFVGYVLAVRERNKFVPKEEQVSKEELIRRINACWLGYFDAQVHNYGI